MQYVIRTGGIDHHTRGVTLGDGVQYGDPVFISIDLTIKKANRHTPFDGYFIGEVK